MIPRIVYQTWHNRSHPFQHIVRHNQEMNPEYQFILFDDNDLETMMKSPETDARIRDLFFRINPHYGPARADVFRYLVIYLRGGVYMDLKIKCKKPFRDFIRTTDYFLYSYWDGLYYQKDVLLNQYGEVQNWFLAARPRSPLLEKMLQTMWARLVSKHDVHLLTGKQAVLECTGPLLYTKTIEPLLTCFPTRRIFSQDVLDYGTSFRGYEEGHYSFLTEPLFLSVENPFKGITDVFPFVKKKAVRILPNVSSLLSHCHVVFAVSDRDVYFLAAAENVPWAVVEKIISTEDNQETVFFIENHWCVKQCRINHAKHLVFHHQCYIQFM